MGWLDGWRVGACQGIADRLPAEPPVRRNLRLLYVPQGFAAIDAGVTAALEQSVAELRVAEASRMSEAAAQMRPDAVVVLNGLHVFPDNHLEQVAAIRALGIPTAIWFVDDPYCTDDTAVIAPHYDVVFTAERTCVSLYQSIGCPWVHHLPVAAHPQLFRPMQVPEMYWTDVCFIGNAFWNRVALFDAVAPVLKNKKVFIAGFNWRRLANFGLLQPFIREGWTDVPETVKYYNGAKIVINLHRTTEAYQDNRNGRNWPAESLNPRTFEMAACGAFQLTDWRAELPEHFRVDEGETAEPEIATFRSAAELAHKIEHYLRHGEERIRIAARGFRRTWRDHTFLRRIGIMLDILEQSTAR